MTEPTGIKTEESRHKRHTTNPKNEARNLMDAYSKIFDQWKLHNDNYFKRVQVVMGILQVGLFLAVLRQLSPLPETFAGRLIPFVLGILGVLSAHMWVKLNAKQGYYLEFCRRMFRNLEARLIKLGVPLEYFTTESWIFRPHQKFRQEPPPELIAGVIEPVVLKSKKKSKKRHILRFKWSNETYPDSKDNKGPHSIVKVTGGLISFERVLAKGAFCVWLVVVATFLALLLGLLGCKSSTEYLPQNGDIIFHTSKGSQSLAIQKATHSQYSHMGIIFLKNGTPFVFEAVGPVKFTPLHDWVARGEDKHYVVKRLANAKEVITQEAANRMLEVGELFKGKPYDHYFEWSNDRIYCSELVWKIYKQALNLEIGKLQTMGEFDLSDPLVQEKIRERFGDSVPIDETVISPAAIFASNLLITVHKE